MNKQTKLDFEVKELVIEYRMIYNCLINDICCEVLKIDNESQYNELTETGLLITTEKRMKEINDFNNSWDSLVNYANIEEIECC